MYLSITIRMSFDQDNVREQKKGEEKKKKGEDFPGN